MTVIEAKNLSKNYLRQGPRESLRGVLSRGNVSDFWAVEDVTFQVKAGEAVGIIGKNGAGKTTLIKMLSHLTQPTEGMAVLTGRVLTLIDVGAGFHPELTSVENLYLNGAYLGASRNYLRKRQREIFEFAGLLGTEDQPLRTYSKGMSARLAVSTALHLDWDVLMLDEALEGLDGEFHLKCLTQLKDSLSQGKALVLVTHDLLAVRALCARVVWMEKGKVLRTGSTEEVLDAYDS